MIRFLILAVVIGAVVFVIWWDRTEASKKRQIFFSLYNKAMAKVKEGQKLHSVSINILDVMDETDINPTPLHKMLKQMEIQQYVTVKSNTVKLTAEGVAYFKFKYMSEDIKS